MRRLEQALQRRRSTQTLVMRCRAFLAEAQAVLPSEGAGAL
jgi:hypothetical protein